MPRLRSAAVVVFLYPAIMLGQSPFRAASPSGPTKVGPPKGTVIVVGGGAMGPEIYAKFIEAAGGPDALIIDVPNAGGADSYGQDGPGTRGWKTAGATNVHVLFTKDRKVADSDSFVAVIKKANAVWFEGGRQYHLVDDYGGTKAERAFREVLERGGVVGGSSAGASILGDFLVRGAPSQNNRIMDYPGYEKGFAYLRNVGIDQHVVARERLPDLADSILTKYPKLLGISEDEGTAWVVRGDTATIIGRNKAFVYGGNDPNDPGVPFLTLRPGDTYNLAARRVVRRVTTHARIHRLGIREIRRSGCRRRNGAGGAGWEGAREQVLGDSGAAALHADNHGAAIRAGSDVRCVHGALLAAPGSSRGPRDWRHSRQHTGGNRIDCRPNDAASALRRPSSEHADRNAQDHGDGGGPSAIQRG
jgi:cyanophycinase